MSSFLVLQFSIHLSFLLSSFKFNAPSFHFCLLFSLLPNVLGLLLSKFLFAHFLLYFHLSKSFNFLHFFLLFLFSLSSLQFFGPPFHCKSFSFLFFFSISFISFFFQLLFNSFSSKFMLMSNFFFCLELHVSFIFCFDLVHFKLIINHLFNFFPLFFLYFTDSFHFLLKHR